MTNISRLGGQEQDPPTEEPEEEKLKRDREADRQAFEDKGEKVDRRRDADHPILPNPD